MTTTIKFLTRYFLGLARTGAFAVFAGICTATVNDCVKDVGGVTMYFIKKFLGGIRNFFTGFINQGSTELQAAA